MSSVLILKYRQLEAKDLFVYTYIRMVKYTHNFSSMFSIHLLLIGKNAKHARGNLSFYIIFFHLA